MKKLFVGALLAVMGVSLFFAWTARSLAQDINLRCCGLTSKLNIATSAVVVKPAPGATLSVSVTTAGSSAGTASDVTTVAAVAAANLMFSIPNTVGVYYVPFPFLNGLVVTPGSGQVLSISYE